MNFSSLFGLYFHCYPVLFSTQVSDIGPSWSSCILCAICDLCQSENLGNVSILEFLYLSKTNVLMVHDEISMSAHLSVCPAFSSSVYKILVINFVLRNSKVLLLFYGNFVDKWLMYCRCGSCTCYPSTPYYLSLNFENICEIYCVNQSAFSEMINSLPHNPNF